MNWQNTSTVLFFGPFWRRYFRDFFDLREGFSLFNTLAFIPDNNDFHQKLNICLFRSRSNATAPVLFSTGTSLSLSFLTMVLIKNVFMSLSSPDFSFFNPV